MMDFLAQETGVILINPGQNWQFDLDNSWFRFLQR